MHDTGVVLAGSYDELLERGENPVHAIRLGLGLSMRRAAEKIGCHYQTIYMVEHGMCEYIFPVVFRWAVENSDFTGYQIEDSFNMFLARKRGVAREKYSLETLPVAALGIPGTNPIKSLRQFLGLSTSGFCKDLCIPVALLHSSEKAKNFSGSMCIALHAAGIDERILEEIEERYGLL